MRKSISFFLGVLIAFVGNTFAQIPISSLPPATLPLSGTEQVILNQGNPGTTKRAPVSAIGSASVGKPAGSFQAFFQSGDVQWNNNGVMFGTDQFIMGLAIPLPDGTNGAALLLGSGYGPGGSPNPGKAWIITDQAFDNFTPGNTLGITAGETQGAGTANGGLLWLLGGASFGGKGGQLLLQGGTSANGAGGDTVVQGGNATGATGAAIPGDLFLEGGNTGRQGANVQLISTTLNGTSGVVRVRNNSTFLWDFYADGSLFSYLGGGFGTSGQALVTGGPGTFARWSPVVTGPAGATTQIQFNNAGVLGASADFTFNSGTRTLNIGSTGAFLIEPVINAAGAGRGVTIRSGGSSLAGNSGGALDIRAGASSGAAPGATFFLTGGSGGTTGTGGTVQVNGGAGGTTSGQGGGVVVNGGTATNGVGGPVSMIAGNGAGTNRAGGAAGVQAGDGIGTAAGGLASLLGGNAPGTGIGGGVNVTGGASASIQPGGAIAITGGANNGATTGAGGSVTIKGGDTNGGAGTSGSVTIQAGAPNAGGANGNINISANSGGATGGIVNVTSSSTISIAASSTVTLAGGIGSTFATLVQAPQCVGCSFGLQITAGSNASDLIMQVKDAASSTTHLNWFGDGGLVFDGATGSDQGLGTINVSGGFFKNGVQVLPTVQCTTACSVAGMPVGQTARVMKVAATNRATTTTPTADPDLQFTNVPVGRYVFRVVIDATVVTAVGMNVSFSNITSTSTNIIHTNNCTATPASTAQVQTMALSATYACSPGITGGIQWTAQSGVLVSALSTVSFNWSQVVSSATVTAVNPDSFLELTRLQ